VHEGRTVAFDLLVYIPESPDTIAGDEADAVINRTQINDNNATNSLHFTSVDTLRNYHLLPAGQMFFP